MKKMIWIYTLNFLIFFKFEKCFATLSQAEEEITLELIKKHDIKSLVLIENSLLNIKNLNQIKILRKLEISCNYLSGAKVLEYFLKESSFHVNILIIFKNYDISDIVKILNYLYMSNQYGYFNMFKWIWFTERELTITEEQQLNIPYDCLFLIVYPKNFNIYYLKEIYQVKGKRFSSDYGLWSNDKGLIIKNSFIYTRRLDLNGTLFTLQTRSLQFCEFVRKARECVNLQILKDYAQLMNIRYDWQPMSAANQGIIGDIFNLVAVYDSFAVSDSDPYDYLAPFFKVLLNWYIRKPSYRVQSDYYIRPFSIGLWSCIFLCLIVGVAFGIFSYCISKRWKTQSTFVNLIFMALDNICNQDGSSENKRLSFKIATFSFRFFALFIISAYSGTILSYLAVKRLIIPFKSLSEFTENGQYVIAAPANSYPHFYFEDNKAPLIKEIFENHFLPLTNITRALLVTKICDELVAFAALNNDFDALRPWCGLYRVKRPITYVFSSIRVLKHSPFVRVFNYLHLRFYSSGIQEKLEEFLLGEGISTLEEEDSFSSVPVTQMVQLLSIVPIGIMIAVIIFLCEMIFVNGRRLRVQKKTHHFSLRDEAIKRRNVRIERKLNK